MLGHSPSGSARHAANFVACIAVASCVLGAVTFSAAGTAAAQAAAVPAARLKAVSYRGYTFKVPAAWPVLDLASHAGTCVRFDLHTVYLGMPGANERCPSWLIGATEALLIQPGARYAQRSSREDPVSNVITASAPRISVTATFNANPAVIYRALASAGLPKPTISAGERAEDASPGGAVGASAPALPALVANDRGLGFDSCAAPSTSFMAAWRRHSPYRAVGIYIGGADRACDQVNLTSSWVRAEAAAGWRFMPMYAGPQPSLGQLRSPGRQGIAAARDAAVQAELLGFGPRTPIYYDMAAYPSADAAAALRFLSAWTSELHKLGYSSAVYSSSAGIVDLAGRYRAAKFAVPDVVYAALWNGLSSTSGSIYRPGEWTGGRRVHQYSGNVFQTFGGDTMNIDQDYLDLTLPTPGGTMQATPAVAQPRGQLAVFYRGADHRLWEESGTANGNWQRTDLGGYLTSGPSVVRVNTTELDVFYRGGGGYLWQRRRTASGWQRARKLTLMRSLGGGPRAVAQSNGIIDVFWKGSHDDHLWHGQYSPGEGWTGPQNLHGSLASWPSPAETRAGQVQVFWRGTDGNLWHVVRNVGLPFTGPADLGMGPLGGAPSAVALPDAEIDVFWPGPAKPTSIWAGVLRGRHVRGPSRLGGVISGQPWPVVVTGTERVIYCGADGRLWWLARRYDGRWAQPSMTSLAYSFRSSPFAAARAQGGLLEVFWVAVNGHLLAGGVSKAGRFERQADLGGRVG